MLTSVIKSIIIIIIIINQYMKREMSQCCGIRQYTQRIYSK